MPFPRRRGMAYAAHYYKYTQVSVQSQLLRVINLRVHCAPRFRTCIIYVMRVGV